MKFTCKKDKLKNAISKIERIVSKQTSLPVLSNILIKTEKGRLVLMATNLEIAIKVFINAKVEEEGEVTVPPRILSGFLNNIKDDIVNSEVIDDKFYIKSENHNIQIKTLNSKDFPIIPEMSEEYYFQIKAVNLIKAIGGVSVSVAVKDTRQEMNGICVKFEDDKLILASTDSFRLMEINLPILKDSVNDKYKEFLEKTREIIMPGGIIPEIQQFNPENNISIYVDENQIFFNDDGMQVTSQLINGRYPDYKQIIPTDCQIKVEFNKDEFLDAVKIASLVTNNQNGEVKISKTKDEEFLTITAQSVDLGENISTVNIENGKESEFEIYFNHRYLIEGINSGLFANSDKILMKFEKEKSPVLFKAINKGEEVDSFLYMVMPIIK